MDTILAQVGKKLTYNIVVITGNDLKRNCRSQQKSQLMTVIDELGRASQKVSAYISLSLTYLTVILGVGPATVTPNNKLFETLWDEPQTLHQIPPKYLSGDPQSWFQKALLPKQGGRVRRNDANVRARFLRA